MSTGGGVREGGQGGRHCSSLRVDAAVQAVLHLKSEYPEGQARYDWWFNDIKAKASRSDKACMLVRAQGCRG